MIEIRNLTKIYTQGKKRILALEDVSLTLNKGEIISLVGESGSGKSTLGKMLLRLIPPTSGHIFLEDQEITHLHTPLLCRRMQMIFQDPFSSLNPRMTIGGIIAEPLKIHHLFIPEKVDQHLDQVGLSPSLKRRYPHELSGGQRQRVAIARALTLAPDLLVCDEALSSLDATTQSQIMQLLLALHKELRITYLFITHDLALAHRVSHRLATLDQGRLVGISK